MRRRLQLLMKTRQPPRVELLQRWPNADITVPSVGRRSDQSHASRHLDHVCDPVTPPEHVTLPLAARVRGRCRVCSPTAASDGACGQPEAVITARAHSHTVTQSSVFIFRETVTASGHLSDVHHNKQTPVRQTWRQTKGDHCDRK